MSIKTTVTTPKPEPSELALPLTIKTVSVNVHDRALLNVVLHDGTNIVVTLKDALDTPLFRRIHAEWQDGDNRDHPIGMIARPMGPVEIARAAMAQPGQVPASVEVAR